MDIPGETSPGNRKETCIQDCKSGCNEEFGFFNPQRYICRSYCDNTCTGTPDAIDELVSSASSACSVIRQINAAGPVVCFCSVLQVLDVMPGVSKDPGIVYADAMCAALSTAVTICDAIDDTTFTNVVRAEAMLALLAADFAIDRAKLPEGGEEVLDLFIGGAENMISCKSLNPFAPQWDCLVKTGTTVKETIDNAIAWLGRLEDHLNDWAIGGGGGLPFPM